MPTPYHRLPPLRSLGPLAASLCARSGLSWLARMWRPSDVCVVTFHGVIKDEPAESGVLDKAAHTPVALFTQLCEHLAQHYHVISASELIRARARGERLPLNSVVITFDDGYESNYELAWPVLKSLRLPATIFLVSGYLDGELLPWFVRLELAVKLTSRPSILGLRLVAEADKLSTYGTLCRRIKGMPWTAAMALMDAIEEELDVRVRPGDLLPAALRPMTWDMAREMQASGLIELGGHTHTHPVLARCTDLQAHADIGRCAERLSAELGSVQMTFAYPNGRPEDFSPVIARMLAEAGFSGAFSMVESFVAAAADPFALPRYGSPSSTVSMEAMVSGVAQRLRQLRLAMGLRSSGEVQA